MVLVVGLVSNGPTGVFLVTILAPDCVVEVKEEHSQDLCVWCADLVLLLLLKLVPGWLGSGTTFDVLSFSYHMHGDSEAARSI